jgi:hypothetical protein
MVIYTLYTQGTRFVESHISRKTSEMWGTRQSVAGKNPKALVSNQSVAEKDPEALVSNLHPQIAAGHPARLIQVEHAQQRGRDIA